MAAFTGRNGTAQADGVEIGPLLRWSLRVHCRTPQYSANDTGPWRRRLRGAMSADGSMQLFADDEIGPPIIEGDIVQLTLHLDEPGDHSFAFDAVVQHVETVVEIGSNRIVAYDVVFASDGQVTRNGLAAKAE